MSTCTESARLLLRMLLVCVLIISVISVRSEKQIFGDIYYDSRNLELYTSDTLSSKHKCEREIPAVLFQTIKDVPIRGNGSNFNYQRIEVCCKGYVRSPHNWQLCVPDCSTISSNNCINGFCRAPNKCTCFEEFVLNDHGNCVHTCPIACQGGRCHLNGTCECHSGYTLDAQTRQFCRPECLQSCGHHQECVTPGKCVCKRGYIMTTELGCQPICAPDCGHGQCVGPNQCQCFSGYMKRHERDICEAECYISCENGFCESSFKCKCRDGFKYDSKMTNCIPDCGNDCQNGVCTAPGVCRCFKGYERKENNCVPKCPRECGLFGKCVEPDVCGCGATNLFCISGECNNSGSCICKNGLIYFIDRCVAPTQLPQLLGNEETLARFNQRLKLAFENIIGNLFQFGV